MKKVKMNAKLFMAVVAMTGISLTSCEKEDFTVDVPNIEITNPEVSFPETPNGVIFVQLSASSNKGELLDGVAYTNKNGEAVAELIPVTEATELEITAKKEGYMTSSKKISVPAPVKGTMMTLPINFVLAEIVVDESTNDVQVQGKPTETEELKDKVNAQTPVDGWKQDVQYTTNVTIPAANPYMSSEQKEALYKEIETNLKTLTTRAAAADVEVAKANLKAQVKEFASKPADGTMPISFTLTEAADEVVFNISTEAYIQQARFSTTVNDVTYYVDGSYTFCGMSTVTATADGTTVGHGHGHGSDNNAGGGVGGK